MAANDEPGKDDLGRSIGNVAPGRDAIVGSNIDQSQKDGIRFGDDTDISGLVVGGNVGSVTIVVQNSTDIQNALERSTVQQVTATGLCDPANDTGDPPESPYPGMRAFSLEDTQHFYGREAEVRQMVTHLRTKRFLMVGGPSSSGKSSVISAGLVPRLVKSPFWTKKDYWRVARFTPGPEPLARLAGLFGGNLAQPSAAVEALLSTEPRAERLLLIVDPFDEIFTQANPDDQTKFIETLKAFRELETCAIVITLREDFYMDLNNSAWGKVPPGDKIEIPPLDEACLRDAIEKPAQLVGVTVEPRLVDRLVADANEQPGYMPLLQETLLRLWAEMKRCELTLDAYQRLGRDGRSGLEIALVDQATSTLEMLSEPQQVIARRIFLRLVQFGEGRPDTRRQQPVATLPALEDDPKLFRDTLQHLTQGRLLTPGTSGDGTIRAVDLAHESLIRAWPQMQEWLTGWREGEQQRRKLEDKVAEWQQLRKGNEQSGLLDAGELAIAEGWLNGYSAELGASEALNALVEASRAAIRTEELERERAYQSQLRQLRALQATALASTAVSQIEYDPELALLLAIEATNITWSKGEPPVLQAVGALHKALLHSAVRLTLRGHTARVLDAIFSTDGRSILTVGEDGTAILWDVATGQQRLKLGGESSKVNSAVLNNNGLTILTITNDKQVTVWDITTGQERLILDVKANIVNRAIFDPPGAVILVQSDGTNWSIWDAQLGQEILVRESGAAGIKDAFFSPDGSYVVAISKDNVVVIDAQTRQPRFSVEGFRARCSADGKTIATTLPKDITKVWDATTGKELFQLPGQRAEYSPNGRSIITITNNRMVKVWDAQKREDPLTLTDRADQASKAFFSPDGTLIVTMQAGSGREAAIWDARTGDKLITLMGHTGAIRAARFSPDSKSIVTASDDGTAKVWQIRAGGEYPTLWGHKGRVNSAVYSPDGLHIVTASNDGTARIWDAGTGQQVTTLIGHREGQLVNSAAYSRDGRHVVTASNDSTARVWDAGTGQVLATLEGHKGWVFSASFSADGQRAVTSSADKTVRVWDVQTQRLLLTLEGYQEWVQSARYSPDGKFIITASDDQRVVIWDAATGNLHLNVPDPERVLSVAYSADGSYFVTTSASLTAKLYDTQSGKLQRTIRGHTKKVVGVACSPNGPFIATASWDETARLWNADTGQELAVLGGHVGKVYGVSFSPDGRRIVTAGDDGTARQYICDAEELLALAVTRVTRGLTDEERATYLLKGPPAE
jgi:WD40 repeat protein